MVGDLGLDGAQDAAVLVGRLMRDHPEQDAVRGGLMSKRTCGAIGSCVGLVSGMESS